MLCLFNLQRIDKQMGNSASKPKKPSLNPNLKDKLIRMKKSNRVIQLRKKIYEGIGLVSKYCKTSFFNVVELIIYYFGIKNCHEANYFKEPSQGQHSNHIAKELNESKSGSSDREKSVTEEKPIEGSSSTTTPHKVQSKQII